MEKKMKTNTINISEQWINERMEGDTDRASGYYALNASGKGKLIETIVGALEIVVVRCGAVAVELAKIEGRTYSLRDAVDFARAGTHGLSIA